MPADPASRYVEDFDCDLERALGRDFLKDLEAMDHNLEPCGRVNGLVSPEERQAK